MMKPTSALICGAIASLLACDAEAFPLAKTSVQATSSEVLQVRNFCGLGFHRDVYGYCRPNGVPYVAPAPVVVAPPIVVAPRVCPYGYAWAPRYGRCVLL